jgi:DNA-binding beta-propeller fold protein YncE
MNEEKRTWLERSPIPTLPWLTIEVIAFVLVVMAAVATRFYDLETRVMSHDESLHTYYSWELYMGRGYEHNPMMHGPLQFHLLALSYFVFGASDFTARVPAVLFSIATVFVLWYWRRYLGKAGVLAAGAMMVLSPYMLYYGRYVRNESFVAFFGLICLYAVLRYLETGRHRYLYLMSAATVLHFTVKETSFIYTAELMIFLGAYFVASVTRKPWQERQTEFRGFILGVIVTIIGIGGALAVAIVNQKVKKLDAADVASPVTPGALDQFIPPSAIVPLEVALVLIGLSGLVAGLYFLVKGYSLEKLRRERSLDMLVILISMVLPMLTPFPMVMLGWNPLDYSTQGIGYALIILIPLVMISVIIGYVWKWELWWRNALLFYAIFTVFYTTLFTNGPGFFTGLIGSLGYWLEQQGVERGSQPWYFYLLVQVPIYEFLPFIASLLAAAIGWRRLAQARAAQTVEDEILEAQTASDQIEATLDGEEDNPPSAAPQATEDEQERNIEEAVNINLPNTYFLLGWWSFASLLAFTLAGEKMPWLTVHITLPMILWGGWAIGSIIERMDWEHLRERNIWLVISLSTTFVLSLLGTLIILAGDQPPFQGRELHQLSATTTFIIAILGIVGSLAGLFITLNGWRVKQLISLSLLSFFGILTVLTARAAFRATYINYDNALEYLVYAHGYTGNKDILRQVMDLSEKTTGDPYAIVVGYDDDTSWPMSWYMRDFKNARFYGNQPGRDLRDVPAIIVGNGNYSKIEPIVDDNFYQFDYIRMVWPNQDYFNLVPERPADLPFDENYSCQGWLSFLQNFKDKDYSRICDILTRPEMRAAIFQVWLNRNYTLYGQVSNNPERVKVENWDPSDRMRLYIRKDAAEKVWKYGASAAIPLQSDPYESARVTLPANLVFGLPGSETGQFNAPRAIAFAPDGSIYVADSRNHRIQHFDAEGNFIHAWGGFAAIDYTAGAVSPVTALQQAPLGTFHEPWGVAVGPDGSVYVTDTWNHRIQKFTAEGKPVKAWGTFGVAEEGPDRFYGPRGLSVDRQGRIFIADTGNKRIVIYDAEGNLLNAFGSEGFDPGQFYEPVDVKLDAQGNAYVTDTWNRRVQVLMPLDENLNYAPLRVWEVVAWESETLDNKPFLAVAANGHVFITDPENFRVIEFTDDGTFVQTWGDYGIEDFAFGLPSGIAIDAQGFIWVTDAGNQRLMRFTAPPR